MEIDAIDKLDFFKSRSFILASACVPPMPPMSGAISRISNTPI